MNVDFQVKNFEILKKIMVENIKIRLDNVSFFFVEGNALNYFKVWHDIRKYLLLYLREYKI